MKNSKGRLHRATNRLAARRRVSLLQKCCMETLEPRVLLTSVLQWHIDNSATGANTNEVTLTPGNVNSTTFGKVGQITLTSADQVYAEPLYVPNLMITSGTEQGLHNVVIIATEGNNVYAYDTTTFDRLWAVNVGTPVPANSSLVSQGYPNLVNFSSGRVGITGTPVISLSNSGTTGAMYFDATIFDNSQVNVPDRISHKVVKLDISSGNVIASITMGTAAGLTEPSVAGDTVDSVNGVVNFAPGKELQRPGLTLMHNSVTGVDNVYVAYGSYGDTAVYHGWVLGFDTNNNGTSLNLTTVFCTSPNTTLPANDTNSAGGSIWMSAASVTNDGSNLYLVAANGEANSAIGDYSDNVIKLTPDGNGIGNPGVDGYGLHVGDYFRPYNQQALTDTDWDMGASGTVLLPHNELAMMSKQGILYVLDRSNLGGWTGGSPPDNVIQEINLNGHQARSTPVFFNNTLYLVNTLDPTWAFSFDPNTGLLSTTPTMVSASFRYDVNAANPFISANGTSNGIMWSVSAAGTLYAYDASNLNLIYTSTQKPGDSMSSVAHFITPTVVDGRVYVGGNGVLYVFGNQTPSTAAPANPTTLTVSSTSAMQLVLNWAQSSTNETNFLIERSPDGVNNFTQIGSVGTDVTTFTDTNVTVGSMYFYRVRAINGASVTSAYTSVVGSTVQALSPAGNLYHFDTQSNATAVLDTGYSPNNGTLSGGTLPTYVASGFDGTGTALLFNGVASDATQAVQGSVFNTQFTVNGWLGGTVAGVNGVTMTAWIKTTQVGNDNPLLAPALVGVYQTNANNSPYFATPINSQDGWNDFRYGYIDGEGHIGVAVDGAIEIPHAGDNFQVVSNTVVNDGQWHSVAFTRNVLNGLLQVYVDGVFQGSFYGNTGSKSASSSSWGVQIQKNSAGTVLGHSYYLGELDELHVYPQILSASEIAQLGVAAPVPTGLTATPSAAPSIQLTWNAVAATAIDIYRRVGTSGSFTPLTSIQGNATSFTDTSVTLGTQYFYEIRAGDPIGTSNFTAPVSAIAGGASVLARSIFYNNSSYDGNQAADNSSDDSAIATDKQALLPGGTATFLSYTSYDKGINGIIVDVSGSISGLLPGDFTFKVGNDNNPSGWTPVSPADVQVRSLNGGSASRIDVTFANGTALGSWMQITVSHVHTGMLADDVFYFGNAPGESGNSAADAKVTAVDEIGARANPGAAGITGIYDYNRDGTVDVNDENVAGGHYTNFLNALNLISVPGQILGPIQIPQGSGGGTGDTLSSGGLDPIIATAGVVATDSGSAPPSDDSQDPVTGAGQNGTVGLVSVPLTKTGKISKNKPVVSAHGTHTGSAGKGVGLERIWTVLTGRLRRR